LFTLIFSNKNKHEFNKNLEAMTSVINAQLPKKAINVMVSVEMRPAPPLKMGSETYQRANGTSRHSRKLGFKILSKTYRMVECKEPS
jgi:hypothetical protein